MLGVPIVITCSILVPQNGDPFGQRQAYGADQKNRASCICSDNENQWQFNGSSILRLPKALTVFTSNFLTVPAATNLN